MPENTAGLATATVPPEATESDPPKVVVPPTERLVAMVTSLFNWVVPPTVN